MKSFSMGVPVAVETVATFDFRRDVLLFLSTNGGQNSPRRRETPYFSRESRYTKKQSS